MTMDSDSSLDVVNSALYRYKKTNFLFKDPMRPKDLDALLDLELRPTDVFLVTYPKSGSVWMQQILVQIMDIVHPEQAEDLINRNRVPWVEDRLFDEPFRDRPDPRYFGSHLPVDMLPRDVKNKNLKVVYVWRNPRDVLVSLYHFSEAWVFLESPKSFEDFFQDFLNGDVYMGSWFDHVRGYQAERDRLQIHFMKFEDMLKDLRGEVEKLCLFLGQSLTEEQMDRVVETSTFNNMKVNPKANYKDLVEKERYSKNTMRKGVAGDWKNHFTVAQNERFDQVFKEKMRDVSLSCSWE
ncbi:amine sulfotransferase-like [Cynoglossus semilaevis]|uniref:amine sulfotransferase-like n=1 Tax=Cynoglossus semilaevis TaxID=244447 RepID=UPI000D62DA09|nr:amine sulfotransferase-like [Cynoglossus semilaevis]